MDYSIEGRFILLRFKTVDDLVSVNGVHPIKIVLTDTEGDSKIYNFIIKFVVPQRPP